jgi:hypothetical protein
MKMLVQPRPLVWSLVLILITAIPAAALVGILLVRIARKRGVRIRDLVGPGGG